MHAKYLIFVLLGLSTFLEASAQVKSSDRPEWKSFFDHYDAAGTIVIADSRGVSEKTSVYNQVRASKRYSPASTFKIPHTLFALDSGLVRDELQVFRWDGTKRDYEPHNQDQNLHSAMRHSVVWLYESFAKQIGKKKAKAYLAQIDYGNIDPSSASEAYWIDGKLAISAIEQIAFLKKLYRNELPFELEQQLLLKDIMIVEAGKNWILRAKTGWQGAYGWWVGWVEWPSGPVFFVLNIDTPNRWDDLYKREAIARDILLSIDALPPIRPVQPRLEMSEN